MRTLATAVITAALLSGGAGAASVPVESRAAALIELRAAIEDEERALELMLKDPPRRDTARGRLAASRDRLAGVRDFLSTVPGAAAAETMVQDAWQTDVRARDAVGRYEQENAVALIRSGIQKKRAALPAVRAARPPAASPQCSDGKDNDGDGVADWKFESGCTSARDARESSRFTCALETQIAGGRVAVTGSCSGAFSEVELTLLDGLQLNGRFDIKHAPSCRPPTVTEIRCSTKDGQQNPQRLVDIRLTTTTVARSQRLRARFFDRKKRRIATITLQPR